MLPSAAAVLFIQRSFYVKKGSYFYLAISEPSEAIFKSEMTSSPNVLPCVAVSVCCAKPFCVF